MKTIKQLTLFEISEVVAAPPASQKCTLKRWSYSRRHLLEQCPRRYYYEYYGANLKTAKTEPQKLALRLLKALETRHLIAGRILHSVIRKYLQQLQQGKDSSTPKVLQFAKQQYRQQTHYRSASGKISGTNQKRTKILLEFYYGFENALALYEATEERLLAALENFLAHPNFALIRKQGCQPNALPEQIISIRNKDFEISGRIDLLYPNNDGYSIVDWKLGSANEGEDSLQLFAYALGVVQDYNCSPDKIQLYETHLASGTVSEFEMSEQTVRRTKACIIQDLRRMQAMERYGQMAEAEAFTPCAQPKVCQHCPFQQVCPME